MKAIIILLLVVSACAGLAAAKGGGGSCKDQSVKKGTWGDATPEGHQLVTTTASYDENTGVTEVEYFINVPAEWEHGALDQLSLALADTYKETSDNYATCFVPVILDDFVTLSAPDANGHQLMTVVDVATEESHVRHIHPDECGAELPPCFGTVLIDEETIDSDIPSIEHYRDNVYGLSNDELINGYAEGPNHQPHKPLKWNILSTADEAWLPTGQTSDEGLFHMSNVDPATACEGKVAGWSHREFTLGLVPEQKLDEIREVTAYTEADVNAMVGNSYVGVVYIGDVNVNQPCGSGDSATHADLKGARRGLFYFRVEETRPAEDKDGNLLGGSYLPDIRVTVLNDPTCTTGWRDCVRGENYPDIDFNAIDLIRDGTLPREDLVSVGNVPVFSQVDITAMVGKRFVSVTYNEVLLSDETCLDFWSKRDSRWFVFEVLANVDGYTFRINDISGLLSPSASFTDCRMPRFTESCCPADFLDPANFLPESDGGLSDGNPTADSYVHDYGFGPGDAVFTFDLNPVVNPGETRTVRLYYDGQVHVTASHAIVVSNGCTYIGASLVPSCFEKSCPEGGSTELQEDGTIPAFTGAPFWGYSTSGTVASLAARLDYYHECPNLVDAPRVELVQDADLAHFFGTECLYGVGFTADSPGGSIEWVYEAITVSVNDGSGQVDTPYETVHIRTTFNPDFCDNSYGYNSIGWSQDRPWNEIVDSDGLTLQIYDDAGNRVLKFKQDYIAAVTGDHLVPNRSPSGWRSAKKIDHADSVTGSDWKDLEGDPSWIVRWMTSLDHSINNCGWGVDNPTFLDRSPDISTFPREWPLFDYRVVYDVWIDLELFRQNNVGFGRAVVDVIHCSPSKVSGGANLWVTPLPCPQCTFPVPPNLCDATCEPCLESCHEFNGVRHSPPDDFCSPCTNCEIISCNGRRPEETFEYWDGTQVVSVTAPNKCKCETCPTPVIECYCNANATRTYSNVQQPLTQADVCEKKCRTCQDPVCGSQYGTKYDKNDHCSQYDDWCKPCLPCDAIVCDPDYQHEGFGTVDANDCVCVPCPDLSVADAEVCPAGQRRADGCYSRQSPGNQHDNDFVDEACNRDRCDGCEQCVALPCDGPNEKLAADPCDNTCGECDPAETAATCTAGQYVNPANLCECIACDTPCVSPNLSRARGPGPYTDPTDEAEMCPCTICDVTDTQSGSCPADRPHYVADAGTANAADNCKCYPCSVISGHTFYSATDGNPTGSTFCDTRHNTISADKCDCNPCAENCCTSKYDCGDVNYFNYNPSLTTVEGLGCGLSCGDDQCCECVLTDTYCSNTFGADFYANTEACECQDCGTHPDIPAKQNTDPATPSTYCNPAHETISTTKCDCLDCVDSNQKPICCPTYTHVCANNANGWTLPVDRSVCGDALCGDEPCCVCPKTDASCKAADSTKPFKYEDKDAGICSCMDCQEHPDKAWYNTDGSGGALLCDPESHTITADKCGCNPCPNLCCTSKYDCLADVTLNGPGWIYDNTVGDCETSCGDKNCCTCPLVSASDCPTNEFPLNDASNCECLPCGDSKWGGSKPAYTDNVNNVNSPHVLFCNPAHGTISSDGCSCNPCVDEGGSPICCPTYTHVCADNANGWTLPVDRSVCGDALCGDEPCCVCPKTDASCKAADSTKPFKYEDKDAGICSCMDCQEHPDKAWYNTDGSGGALLCDPESHTITADKCGCNPCDEFCCAPPKFDCTTQPGGEWRYDTSDPTCAQSCGTIDCCICDVTCGAGEALDTTGSGAPGSHCECVTCAETHNPLLFTVYEGCDSVNGPSCASVTSGYTACDLVDHKLSGVDSGNANQGCGCEPCGGCCSSPTYDCNDNVDLVGNKWNFVLGNCQPACNFDATCCDCPLTTGESTGCATNHYAVNEGNECQCKPCGQHPLFPAAYTADANDPRLSDSSLNYEFCDPRVGTLSGGLNCGCNPCVSGVTEVCCPDKEFDCAAAVGLNFELPVDRSVCGAADGDVKCGTIDCCVCGLAAADCSGDTPNLYEDANTCECRDCLTHPSFDYFTTNQNEADTIARAKFCNPVTHSISTSGCSCDPCPDNCCAGTPYRSCTPEFTGDKWVYDSACLLNCGSSDCCSCPLTHGSSTGCPAGQRANAQGTDCFCAPCGDLPSPFPPRYTYDENSPDITDSGKNVIFKAQHLNTINDNECGFTSCSGCCAGFEFGDSCSVPGHVVSGSCGNPCGEESCCECPAITCPQDKPYYVDAEFEGTQYCGCYDCFDHPDPNFVAYVDVVADANPPRIQFCDPETSTINVGATGCTCDPCDENCCDGHYDCVADVTLVGNWQYARGTAGDDCFESCGDKNCCECVPTPCQPNYFHLSTATDCRCLPCGQHPDHPAKQTTNPTDTVTYCDPKTEQIINGGCDCVPCAAGCCTPKFECKDLGGFWIFNSLITDCGAQDETDCVCPDESASCDPDKEYWQGPPICDCVKCESASDNPNRTGPCDPSLGERQHPSDLCNCLNCTCNPDVTEPFASQGGSDVFYQNINDRCLCERCEPDCKANEVEGSTKCSPCEDCCLHGVKNDQDIFGNTCDACPVDWEPTVFHPSGTLDSNGVDVGGQPDLCEPCRECCPSTVTCGFEEVGYGFVRRDAATNDLCDGDGCCEPCVQVTCDVNQGKKHALWPDGSTNLCKCIDCVWDDNIICDPNENVTYPNPQNNGGDFVALCVPECVPCVQVACGKHEKPSSSTCNPCETCVPNCEVGVQKADPTSNCKPCLNCTLNDAPGADKYRCPKGSLPTVWLVEPTNSSDPYGTGTPDLCAGCQLCEDPGCDEINYEAADDICDGCKLCPTFRCGAGQVPDLTVGRCKRKCRPCDPELDTIICDDGQLYDPDRYILVEVDDGCSCTACPECGFGEELINPDVPCDGCTTCVPECGVGEVVDENTLCGCTLCYPDDLDEVDQTGFNWATYCEEQDLVLDETTGCHCVECEDCDVIVISDCPPSSELRECCKDSDDNVCAAHPLCPCPEVCPAFDQCGVCEGDGLSCVDCEGLIGGEVTFDACGVKCGDGTTCGNVCVGSQLQCVICVLAVDLCGVCGGNSTSCYGCDGIPASLLQYDDCGICGGANDSCWDTDDDEDAALIGGLIAGIIAGTGGLILCAILARVRKQPDLLTREWDEVLQNSFDLLQENPLAQGDCNEFRNAFYGVDMPGGDF